MVKATQKNVQGDVIQRVVVVKEGLESHLSTKMATDIRPDEKEKFFFPCIGTYIFLIQYQLILHNCVLTFLFIYIITVQIM